MTDNGKTSGNGGGWAEVFRREATPEKAAMFAEHLLDIAFTNAPDTPEVRLLRQAPFLIVGSFNARDVRLTNATLSEALDMFADTIVLPTNLEQDALGEKFDERYAKKDEAGVHVSAVTEEDSAEEDSLLLQRMKERVRASMAVTQKVNDAMAPTIRAELGLAPDTDEYDTYRAMSDTVRRGFGQLLEAVQPGSMSSPDHDIWQVEIVSGMVNAYRAQLQNTVLINAKSMGMIGSAAKPAEPNPIS